jgi:homoaconitase/3-isopropylmalate dehydratase large subunit
VKASWQGRMIQATTKVGDQAPMVAVCCNACRTCTTTNLLALAFGVGAGAVYAVGRFAKRVVVSR